MTYSAQQLSNEKWGIYADERLLATYSCQHTCLLVLEVLQMRNNPIFAGYRHAGSLTKQAA
ncbi:MAG: hypothetical protein AAGE96_00845 [Cyanobacteria bacterium P01_G01_bin.19]